jgi:hypothetical protein
MFLKSRQSNNKADCLTLEIGTSMFYRNVFMYYSIYYDCYLFYFVWLCSPARAMAPSYHEILNHTQRRTTVDRIPLDE